MQKKVLIPLLMAPAAFPALADINVGFPQGKDWTQGGTTADENSWSITDSSESTNITCAVGTGYIETKLNYPAGTYTLTFAKTDNIAISVDGENVPFNGTDFQATIKITGDNGAVLRIYSKNVSKGFSFSGRQLTLVFDDDAAVDQLQAQLAALNEIALEQVPAEDLFPEAEALREQLATIHSRLENYETAGPGGAVITPFGDVWSEIKKIGGTASVDEQIAIYKKYGFDKSENLIDAYFKALGQEIDKYNNDVINETSIFAVYTKNVQTRTDLLTEQSTLSTDIDALAKQIADWQVVDPAIKEKIAAAVAKQQTAINNYKTLIETTFPYHEDAPFDDYSAGLRKDINFTSQFDALKAEIDKLNQDFAKLKADYEVYYNVNFLLLTELDNAYKAYLEALGKAQGVKGYETVYQPIVDEETVVADGLYNDTKEAYKIQNVDGAVDTDKKDKCQANLQAAINEFKEKKANFEQLVNTQNENMTQAQITINEFDKEIDRYNHMVVVGTYAPEFITRLNALKAAVNAIKEYTADKYTHHILDLEGEEYLAQTTDINGKITGINEYIKPLAVINSLFDKLREAGKVVVALDSLETADGKTLADSNVHISAIWASTFKNLSDAISGLTDKNYDDPSVTGPISTEIDNYKADAIAMAETFVKVIDTINGFNLDMAALEQFVADKKIDENGYVLAVKELKKQFYAKYTNEGGEFAKTLAGYADQLAQIKGITNGQACWQQLQKFAFELEKSTVVFDMDNAKIDFAKAASDANLAYANDVYDKLIADRDAADKAGVTNISTSMPLTEIMEIQGELKTIGTQIEADALDTTALGKDDDDIVAVLDKLAGWNQKLQDLIKNQQTYDNMMGVLNGYQTLLDQVKAYNESTSMTPGKEYFGDTVLPGIQTTIDALRAEMLKALNAETMVDKTNGLDGFGAQLNNVYQDILNARIDIEQNNKAHNDQLAREKEVRTYIENLLNTINANENAADLDIVKEWVATLEGLLNTDLPNVNIHVTNAYGNGQSKAENEQIMKEYQDILDKATQIDADYNGDAFHQAVVDANTETTAKWGQDIQDLFDQYREGIRVYNYFYYDLKNPGWREFVRETVERHATLFKFFEEITTLNQDALDQIGKWNNANHVITKAEWNVWLAKATGIGAAITTDVNSLWADVDKMAAEYYTQQEGLAAQAIADARAALQNAGIQPDGYLKEAETHKQNAQDLYVPVAGVTADKHVANAMDEVCDELDKVIPSINLQEFAEDAWAKKYAAAETEIEALRTEIEGYKHAMPEVKTAALQSFTDYVLDAQNINTEATGVTEGLINRFKQFATDLDAVIDNLKGLRDEVKKSNDLNYEDQQLQDKFDKVWLPDMNSSYEALEKYCNSLGGCADMDGTLANIKGEIETLVTLVANNGGHLVDLKLEDRYNGIMTSIANAYKQAYDMEVGYLRDLVKNTKIAFNDAFVKTGANENDEPFVSLDKTIEDINADIELLPSKYNAANPESNQDALIGYESSLCDIYVQLQSLWTDNPATAILDNLNKRYDTLSGLISTGEETLAGCMDSVKEEFAGKYAAIQSELDEQKADWSDDGNRIIVREGYYNKALDAINAAITELTENIAKAEQAAQEEAKQHQISNERYDALYAEYTDLLNEFEAAKALVEGYGNGVAEQYEWLAANIQSMLTDALTDLENRKAAFSLTETSTLLNGEDITAAISQYKLNSTRMYAGIELGNASAAASEANGKLRDLRIVPAEYKVLIAEYNAANDELQDLLDEKGRADFERLGEIIDRAKTLAETFASIADRAQENSYVLGDVDMDEDAQVNVLDVQMLINFVGEGITYQQLYAENPRQACAADIDGNETINIADVTSLIQMILGDDVQVVRVKAHKPVVKSNDSLSIALVSEENGVKTYALCLSNAMAYTGAQFDIKASGDARIASVMTTDRTEGHEAALFDNNLGEYRVVMASMANETFAGQDGSIVLIEVEGKGELTISNAMFTDENNNIHEIAKAHTSTLDAIYDYVKDGAVRIYDAAGRRLNSIKSGINIIRHKDGKVTKEMRK